MLSGVLTLKHKAKHGYITQEPLSVILRFETGSSPAVELQEVKVITKGAAAAEQSTDDSHPTAEGPKSQHCCSLTKTNESK